MDKLKFRIFYDDEYYRPHVAIKINGKDLAKMCLKELRKMILQGIIEPYCSEWIRLAGRYVDYFINDILTLKNPYILTDTDWVEEGEKYGLVKVDIVETDKSIIWENIGILKHFSFSFEFNKGQYYQEVARLINIYGGVITEEMLDKIPKEIINRLERPLWFSFGFYNYNLWSGRELTTLSKINNEWVDDQWLEEKFLPRNKCKRKRKIDCKKMKFWI